MRSFAAAGNRFQAQAASPETAIYGSPLIETPSANLHWLGRRTQGGEAEDLVFRTSRWCTAGPALEFCRNYLPAWFERQNPPYDPANKRRSSAPNHPPFSTKT
jgi:hypothetical protein